ncbi:hypothetical protein BsWGS_08351 [Bradybaena similaris]
MLRSLIAACGDMDIRNSVKSFHMLENCTVIEGSLHISLIDYVPQEEYDKYSFPLLREITGHLMMFRVFGLRTLRNLFPNLTVIRGQSKFFKDYALVAYEMRDLEELGLTSLTLVNGLVRLTKNHRLCHLSSIDWGQLAPNVDPSKHLIVENREEQLCPDFCDESCPSTIYQDIQRKRCWSPKPNDCQRNLVCKCPNGRQCAPDGSCCHELCLGGCSGTTASECYVCNQVVYKNECMSHCPNHTFMLYNRRCLTRSECLNLRSRSGRINRSDSSDNFPKILMRNGTTPSQCVFKCPAGYMVKEKDPECIRCQGICPKVCNTTKVSSIQDSEVLFGCSKINGSLEIQITGGRDIDHEFTKNLGAIREVTGYIRIWRTYPLYTLHFFRDLEIIGGDKLLHREYSLFVADNTNIKEIFPEEQMKKMIIQKGKIGFHNNRKLCFDKISKFVQHLNSTSHLNSQRVDISNTSNGNLIACNRLTLDLKLVPGYLPYVVVLHWEQYHSENDHRNLINYIINYKEVSEPVKDIFEGRDACSNNDWKIVEHWPQLESWSKNKTVKYENFTLVTPKSFTKYAVYVEAITLDTANISAMTDILYFVSSPYKPTPPMDLEVSSADPHELTVRWNPPTMQNGNVTHYKLFYYPQSPSTDGFEQRDYCKDPIVKDIQKGKGVMLEDDKVKKETVSESDQTPKCCPCIMNEEERLKQHRNRELQMILENDIMETSYFKKSSPECIGYLVKNHGLNINVPINTRRRRNINRVGLDFNNPIIFHYIDSKKPANNNLSPVSTTNETAIDSNLAESSGSSLKRQEVIVYDTAVTLSNLEHFSSYNIEVLACHETDPVTGTKLCSLSALITGQTAADPLANNINSSLVVIEEDVNKSGGVLIRWEPPPRPNGLILKYYVMYKKVDADRSSIPVTVCLSAKQFQNNSHGHLLLGLEPGNYSFQISAHSLAGNGTYTPEVFFSVVSQPGRVENNVSLIIGITAGLVLAILVVFGVIIYHIYKQRYMKADVIVSQNPHYIPTDQLYAPDEWEVPRDNIRLIKELGQGSFGTVFEGLMEDPKTKVSTPVAIKTVNDKADFHERLKILKEATTMKVFECHHIVKLLGVVSRGQPALVIMELMALGDLRNYLRKCRPDDDAYPDLHPPSNRQIHQMAGEIADGMVYLAHKKIVHRDLAARNCLVSHDGTVKIADFGMARDVYMTEYYRKDQRALMPIRWMAPESLSDGIFTTMTDVWSFGIVLWEMVTLAEQPYQGFGNDEVLRFVMTERRILGPPSGCPEDLYDMMKKCWAYNPKHRPTFNILLELLAPYLSDHFHEVSYYYNQLARSNEDGRVEKTHEGVIDMEAVEIEHERQVHDAMGTDRGFDGGDSLSLLDEEIEQMDDDDENEIESNEDGDCAESLDSPPFQCGSYNDKKEHLPLMLQQQNVQEPLLYPPSASAGRAQGSGDLFSIDDDDNDSDSDFTRKDKKHIRSSKDARSSSSERLKLLSDSPNSSRPKLEPSLPAKPSQFAAKLGGSDYTSVSAVSPQVCDEFPSAAAVSSHLSVPSPAVANLPPFSLAPLLPTVAPSSSPVLHVDMEGIGNNRGSNLKQSTAVNMTGHESDFNKPLWLFQNNNPSNKASAISSQAKQSDSSNSSNSNSNTNSIHSSSEGSKDSSSSCGSHNRFTSATANGHGPYTHQHTALC